ncbi:hypothetical protein QIT80_gp92 (endogenous virus) [Pseudomonas phage phiAH14a]|uniref:Uncharacterized protein n=1 Tax=Pseudomonas phage phiAH14a TaxID=1805958 RepID=A0A1B0VMJ7_9CAUD|nr:MULTISPECIES: hypothetical protein [unclassified Pseudomonas]YP_010773109.1 hypothetical protein QIT80_gp92 [Pseudomonas phage phiAH14a]AMW64552.1 hypothetical protein AH14a_p92 [Pseudomonas phage phiAH14a]KAA0946632.1 hypothetical protein FQ182_12970 [Pseudomonas sp. ANT_H4]KAA0953267.1 hypothetical protein FQ186_06895 [Pseudomonas sp. ANT_H14]
MVDWSKLEKIKTPRDLTDQINLGQARAYLRETDWYAFALLEDETPIPSDIKVARTAARVTISQLAPPPAS